MNKPLNQVKKRTLRYWFEDGLSETIIGAFFILVGLMFLIQALAEPGSLLAGLSGLGTALLVGLGVWLARLLIQRLKERLTYPRTGYVSYYPPSILQRALSLILGLIIAVLFGWFIFSYSQELLAWLPFVEGLALAALSFVIGQRAGLFRFYLYALVTLLIGVVLSISGQGDYVGSGWVFITSGLLMSLVGLVALARYLRNSQPVEEAPDGN
ncbi:MAG TPA: hypothetical protein VLA49_15810 [Anaerolineales bacterium]|nr:hypothetical protein [Anaerolineales bacterium]